MSLGKASTRPPRSVPIGQLRRSLQAVQRFRLNFVFGVLLLLFAALLVRLGKLQLVEAHALRAQATRTQEMHMLFRGLRGRILDARGRVLVTSRRAVSVAADLAEVEDPVVFSRRLALLLDEPDGGHALLARILANPRTCRHLLLRAGIEDDRIVEALVGFTDGDQTNFGKTIEAGLRGLKILLEERRTHPNGDYALHVLGSAPPADGRSPGRGMERAFDEALRGDRLSVAVGRNGYHETQHRFRAALVVDPLRAAGRDLQLTLDIVVQHYVECALDDVMSTWQPTEATAIVLDPNTGHILALANRTTSEEPGAQAFNIAVNGSWPPGSIFKPVLVARALAHGVVEPQERIELPPARTFTYRRGSRTIHDVHACGEDDGCGTVLRIVAQSSNVGVAELLWRLMSEGGVEEPQASRAFAIFEDLGFAEPTGIELAGREPYVLDRDPGNPLFPCVGFAFGHHFAISPLRSLCLLAGFARADGRVVRPTLLPGQGGGRLDLPALAASPEHLALLREGMRGTVLEGTAHSAFEGCELEVCGKTGTAEILSTRYQIAGFAGFAPRDRPRLAVLVMAKVDKDFRLGEQALKPYGGNVAAPAARTILERSFAYLDGRALEIAPESVR